MQKLNDEYCKRYVMAMRSEAEQAKSSRMKLNAANYDMYHLKYDFSHKIPGQSKEVLSKTRNATESSKAFFQQALADLDDWFRITALDGSDGEKLAVKPAEMQKLLNYMLKRADYFSHVGASTQSGLLGSLSVSKVNGELVAKPKFMTKKKGKGSSYKKFVVVQDDKTWELRFDNVRQEDYFPDPTGRDLYEIEEYTVDLHTVRTLSKGEDAIYRSDAVNKLKPWVGNPGLQVEKRANEDGQDVANPQMRPQVRLTEFWGKIVDEATGECLAENVVVTIANGDTVIRGPTENPLWHQRSQYVAAALIEFMNSVWGIAMMDAGTKHNCSLIELFNLMLDSAMKTVWGVNQIRVDVLDDINQITDGIPWGVNLKVNSSLPPGAKVMEPVFTGDIPPAVLNMFNLLNQETLTSMKTNDFRMGAQSMRAVKATEIMTAEQSITSEFQGIAKNFEEKKIQPELELACWTVCQNWDRIDKDIFVSLYGQERGEELAAMEPQEVFVQTIQGMKFDVFGISLTLRRQADYRKWTTLLQTIGASEVLIEAFLAKYSFEKLLAEIMTALDLNKTKIQLDQDPGPQQGAAMAQPGGAPGASPNMMSQIPPAQNTPGSALEQVFSGAVPGTGGRPG